MLLNELPEENSRKRGRGRIISLCDALAAHSHRVNREDNALAAILSKLQPCQNETGIAEEEYRHLDHIPSDPVAEQQALSHAVERYINQLPGFRKDEEVLSGHWMGTFSEKIEGNWYVYPLKATMQLAEGEISGECLIMDDYGKTYRETQGYFNGYILANSNVFIHFQNIDPRMGKHAGRIDLKVDRDRYTAKGRFVGHAPNGREVIGEIEIAKYGEDLKSGDQDEDRDQNMLGIEGKVDVQRRLVRLARMLKG